MMVIWHIEIVAARGSLGIGHKVAEKARPGVQLGGRFTT